MSSVIQNLVQGSPEWKAARLGKITASRFATVCERTAKGQLTAPGLNYLKELAWERLTGKSAGEVFQNFAMKRGNDLEPVARQWYEIQNGSTVEQVGMFVSACGNYSYSPDGLIGGDGLLEIKCPMAPAFSEFALTKDAADYLHQVQGGLWLSGRKWCDLVVFHDDLPEDQQGVIIRIHRDEEFLAKMIPALVSFNNLVEDRVSALRKALGVPA
jgi:exodeoxyribonuclease (lambda-induced)